jgi:hypothetical protein
MKSFADYRELEEAVKIGTKVKIHAPGKDYHGEVGHVGEIRHGAYKGAPKTYTVDYGDKKSIQLDKKEVKVHKEEVELDEAHQVVAKTKQGETLRSAVYPTKEKALSMHYRMAKSGHYKSVQTVPVKEDLDEALDKGEYDYEGQMARTQLQTTMRNCKDMIAMITDDDNMPEWVQSKITLAQDYITSARDYLQSKQELGESVELDEMTQGKEYTQAQLQKKIQSGNWEATHDIKPGKHVEMRHHSGKRVTVQVREESELGDLAHQKTLKHRFLVTYSDPNHTSASMRKEKQQKHVLVPGTKNGESVYKGDAEPLVKKYMKKQGYKVHDVEHVGMVSKKVNEDTKLDEADGKDYHSVHVNGRMWKTFDSKSHADNVAKKIKGATVHKYDAERLQQNYGAKAAARNAARGKQWDENTTTENKTL